MCEFCERGKPLAIGRRTIMDLQYNIRTKLLHLDMTFTEPVVTDWLKNQLLPYLR